jgi:hypothetical protein
VQEEAARALADMARDELRKVIDPAKNQHMAIEVRDENGPLLEVKFTFELTRRANQRHSSIIPQSCKRPSSRNSGRVDTIAAQILTHH